MTQREQVQDASNAFGQLMVEYGPALSRYFGRRIRDRSEVEDLVQEVFARLSKRGDFANITNVNAYIFQTAANVIKDRLRQQLARPVYQYDHTENHRTDDTAFSPERVLIAQEILNRLLTAVEELPVRTRRIFILCKLEGVSHPKIAEKLGVSLSTVDKHLAAALAFLMSRLREDL